MADDNKIIAEVVVIGVDEFKAELKGGQAAVDQFTKEVKEGTADAKKGFEQLTDTTQSWRAQLKGMTSELIAANLQLAEMKDAGQQGTKEFSNLEKKIEDLRKKAGNLKDAMADANDQIKATGSDTAGLDKAIRAVGSATAAFQVFEGATVLAGKGNEDLQKALVKLNAVMAITQGLQQIQNELVRDDSVFKGLATKATAAYNIVVGQSTGALKAFRIALAATGIGLIVIAIGALVANWDKFTNAIRNSFPALDNVIKFFENIRQFGAGTIAGIVEGFSVIGEVISNIFKGQFSQAIDVAKDFGKRTAQAYNQAYAEEDEKIKIEQSLEQRKLNERLLSAQGKDTLAIRLKIAQDELKLLEKNSKEYNDKLVEIEDLKYKILQASLQKQKEAREAYLNDIIEQNQTLQAEMDTMNASVVNSLIQIEENSEAWFQNEISRLQKIRSFITIGSTVYEALGKQIESLKNKQSELFSEDTPGVNFKKYSESIKNGFSEMISEATRFKEIQETAGKANEVYQTLGSVISQTTDIISNATQIRAEKEIQALENKRKRGLISEKQYEREVAKIKNESARKTKIAQTIMAFAMIPEAVLRAFTSALVPGDPSSIVRAGIFAGIAGAFATAQAALIAATPLPKFRDGGSVAKRLGLMRGKSHEQGGIPIEVEGNEYVMNKRAVSKYGVDFMDSINNLKLSPAVTMQAKLDNLNNTDYKLYEHLSTLGSYMKQDYRTNETGNRILINIQETLKRNNTYV